jgi:excisionase family DNA binding protein
MSEYITTEELAQIYNVNIQTVRRWVRTGKIKGRKIGKRFFIQKDEANIDEKHE